ncbi:hypothetical protein BJX66DRAFT_338794 [Aspergillus keveii]|uniref:N-acetyltransferase domain-containing protein n=1 Tax=Aspergillus keveii TaxID=714993 RepID=A0ABR4G369_9EURO
MDSDCQFSNAKAALSVPSQPQSGPEGEEELSEMDMTEDNFASEELFEFDDELDLEDEEPAELNAENHFWNVSTTGGNIPLKITLFTLEESDCFPWVNNFLAKVTQNDQLVARLLARLIQRGTVRRSFWEHMDDLCRDTSNIAFELFDRGSGVWQTELDNGPLLIVEELHVLPSELRRKGLGFKMLQLLLGKAQRYAADKVPRGAIAMLSNEPQSNVPRQNSLHVITSPDWLYADVEPRRKGKSRHERRAIGAEAHDAAVAFFRACGFRRIAIDDDVDPAYCAVDEYEGFVEPERGGNISLMMDQYRLDRLKASNPFHHAGETLSNGGCLEFLKGQPSAVGSTPINNSNATLLHAVACAIKPRSLEWILENVAEARKWQFARNLQGLTPIESLKDKLESIRSTRQAGGMTLIVSDYFTGFKTEATRSGCTCGQCLEGFLSPRMVYALNSNGSELRIIMESSMIDDGESWVEWHEEEISYLTEEVQENLQTNKSLRHGFINIFALAAGCLERNIVPRATSILEQLENEGEWPPNTKNFLRRAGDEGINAALRYLLRGTEERDEMARDGQSMLLENDTYTRLPVCRNDHEFRFVSLAWGLEEDC